MRAREKFSGGNAGPYQPSPRDIRRACESIQRTWTERERRKRSGLRTGPCGWMPPNVVLDSLTEAADEAVDGGSQTGSGFSRDTDR